jgi:hypothetical protein
MGRWQVPFGGTQEKDETTLSPFRAVDRRQGHTRTRGHRAKLLQGGDMLRKGSQRGKEGTSCYRAGEFSGIVARRMRPAPQQPMRHVAHDAGRTVPGKDAQLVQILEKRGNATLSSLPKIASGVG